MGSHLTRVGLWLTRFCLTLSALCLIALIGLTVAEVLGRYAFNRPIFGRQDVAQILLAASIFLAFPVATLRGEQIAVDLLDTVFSPSAAFWRDRAIEALMSVCLLTMGLWLWDRAEKALSRGNTSEMLSIPKYPLIGCIAIGVALTGALLAVKMLVSIRRGSAQ